MLSFPFALRAIIRGWLGRPPAGRRAREQSGPPPPLSAEALDALSTLATQQADQSRHSTGAGAPRRASHPEAGTTADTSGA